MILKYPIRAMWPTIALLFSWIAPYPQISIPTCFAQPEQGFELVFPAMGTTVTLAAFAEQSATVEQAFNEARKEVERLISIFSDYDEESELSHLNSSMSSGRSIRVSAELWEVLAAADRWNRISEGAFDPSIGALTRLWRQHRRQGKIPSEADLEAALQKCGWRHLRLDSSERSITCLRSGLAIDLGAIAKGFIVDRAFEVLLQHKLECCMVNAGGDLRCGRAPPGRSGWKIGIAPLQVAGTPLRSLQLSNAAIATSGDLWQFSIINGTRRSHILDPRTGMGVEGPMSLSAIAPTALEADAAATALSVLGVQRGCKLAEDIPEIEAMAILSDQPHNALRYSVTSGFAR